MRKLDWTQMNHQGAVNCVLSPSGADIRVEALNKSSLVQSIRGLTEAHSLALLGLPGARLPTPASLPASVAAPGQIARRRPPYIEHPH